MKNITLQRRKGFQARMRNNASIINRRRAKGRKKLVKCYV